MAKARKASKTQAKLMMILYGAPFTGKSTLAMQLAYFKRKDGKPFRVLYLDPESGSIDDYLGELESNGVNLDNIYIVYTQSLGEVRQYIAKVKNHEDFYELDDEGNETDDVVLDADGKPFRADAIVVDGTSILNLTTKQGLIEFSKKRNKVKADAAQLVGDARLVKIEGAGLELKDYQTVNFKGQDLILDLMASGVHCIVTAREKHETQNIKDADGKVINIETGKIIIDGFKGMNYNAKTVIRTFRDENGTVCMHVEKDRTHVHEDNEIVEDPTLLDYQTIIKDTANEKEFVLKNDLSKAVNIEKAIYKKELLGDDTQENSSFSNEESTHNNADNLRRQIMEKKKGLSAVNKGKLKAELEEKGLPTAYKNVIDVDILNKVLSIMEKYTN